MNAWMVLAMAGPAAIGSVLRLTAICRAAAAADQHEAAAIQARTEQLAQQAETYLQFTAITSGLIPGDDQ